MGIAVLNPSYVLDIGGVGNLRLLDADLRGPPILRAKKRNP
jgi:hypothetical protein